MATVQRDACQGAIEGVRLARRRQQRKLELLECFDRDRRGRPGLDFEQGQARRRRQFHAQAQHRCPRRRRGRFAFTGPAETIERHADAGLGGAESRARADAERPVEVLAGEERQRARLLGIESDLELGEPVQVDCAGDDEADIDRLPGRAYAKAVRHECGVVRSERACGDDVGRQPWRPVMRRSSMDQRAEGCRGGLVKMTAKLDPGQLHEHDHGDYRRGQEYGGMRELACGRSAAVALNAGQGGSLPGPHR